MHDDYDDHSIRLRDVATPDDDRCPDDMDRGCLVVSYDVMHSPSESYHESRSVSARLPVECLALFDGEVGGRIDVADLTPEERAWIASASAAHGNAIEFDGTEAGPEPDLAVGV